MSYLGKSKKCDLIKLASELGETVPPESKIIDLKEIIINSKNYDEPFVKEVLLEIINERIKQEEQIEREKEREFELQKLRIENENKLISQTESNDRIPEVNKNTIDLRNLIQKFDLKDGDIASFLVLFERQAKRIGLKENDFVTHLLGLLPQEITNQIARQSEQEANEYPFVKNLLLKRYKLSPETFRQKFVNHVKDSKGTWSDFVFDLNTYFNEWLAGLEITDFESLKNLIVTEQLKKKVPNVMREYFIDSWPKFVKPNDLAQKLDDYENVRAEIKTNNESISAKYDSRYYSHSRMSNRNSNGYDSTKFISKNANRKTNERENVSSNKVFSSSIRNERGEPKCFSCNEYGHISKDCIYPCKKCGERGHVKRNCTKTIEKRNENLQVCANRESVAPDKYLRRACISNMDITALIDTGSSSCLMRESTAENLGLHISPCIKDLYSFGNQTNPVTQSLGASMVDLEIDGVVGKDVNILIVSDVAQPVDLLVGRTFLDLPYIAYARVGENLHIGYAEDYPFINLECNEGNTKVKIKATETVQIVDNSINFVKAETEDLNNGLITIKGKNGNLDILLEVKEGKTIVPITNTGNRKITLNKNQSVGKAEVVDEKCFRPLEDNKIFTNEAESIEVLNVNASAERKPVTLEQINFDKSLNENQKQNIVHLLNEYRDCFAFNLNELGCTDLTIMDIKEIEGSKPVSSRPYKTNASERNIIKQMVKEWKDHGIVTETRSPYASPVLLVKKKTGEHRLVVDYRRLNNQTVKDKFPLPKIDDLLESLSGAELFTTLDLAHGYLQIPLSEEAKKKTAFITSDETGQFERMIFGLVNAPSEFQRLMYQVLGPLFLTKAVCYLDDILIPAYSWDDMLERLKLVFERLRLAKLTLKLTKCEFGKKEVQFLGFVINANGLKPGPRKIKAIEEYPEPKNIHEVKRFLGLTGFFRRFVTKYAEKAEPLSRLTKKNQDFEWKEEQKNAFCFLKETLTNQPVLAHYNPTFETEVHTDASSEGLSGMLLQRGNDEKWHLVYCVSKKTTDVEKKYHSSKLELMAIVWTLDRLRQYLLGIKFVIITDCQALIYMNSKKTTNPQIARWYDLIQEFDIEVKHRPGTKMCHVDAMSRAPVLEPEDTLTTIIERNLEVCLTLSEEEQVLVIQHADRELRKLIDIFRKDEHERTNAEKQKICNYVFKGNKLYRKVKENRKERLLYVIPRSMRKSTAVKFHDLMGHFSVDRTANKIKELYWFPYMKRYLRRHIAMCFECLMNKVPGGKQQGYLHPIKPGKRPFSLIHLDHLGPFVKSSKGNQDLLVIIDNFTRFTRLTPVKNTSSQHVLKAFKLFVDEFGLPDRIVSDRGPCFTSRQFEQYCQYNGIHHTLNSTKHPQGNGMVERVNRTILSTITTSMKDNRHKDWDLRIKETERNLNNVVNKTTDKTPFEMLHGYSPRFNDGILRKVAELDAEEWRDPKEIQDETYKEIEKKQLKMKESYDKKRCRTMTFDPGEIVVVRRPPKPTGEPTKTQAKYRGPLIITEVLPNDTYKVTQLEEKQKGRFYATTAHVSQLKPWRSYDDDNSDEESCVDPSEPP